MRLQQLWIRAMNRLQKTGFHVDYSLHLGSAARNMLTDIRHLLRTQAPYNNTFLINFGDLSLSYDDWKNMVDDYYDDFRETDEDACFRQIRDIFGNEYAKAFTENPQTRFSDLYGFWQMISEIANNNCDIINYYPPLTETKGHRKLEAVCNEIGGIGFNLALTIVSDEDGENQPGAFESENGPRGVRVSFGIDFYSLDGETPLLTHINRYSARRAQQQALTHER